MKTAQWVAVLLVSAGVVFGLTFAANYLGRGGPAKTKTAPAASQAQLTWADNVTNYPADPANGPAACEIGHGGTADFWFKNDNAQTLPIGVHSKTCQCTSVQLWLAKERKDVPEAADREKAVKELEAAGSPVELKEREAAFDVPAGAVGVLRLAWKGDRPGPKDLAAELWMGEDGPGPTRRFVIRTVFVGPLAADKEFAAGDVPQEKLPHEVHFPCWSATRTQFPLSARMLQYRSKDEALPWAVADPVPLTEAELADLRKNPARGPVLSGYMVRLTLLKESKDGAPFDLGIFRRHVELSTEGADPIQVAVQGTILGDLSVVGPEAGPVKLGSFYRDQSDVKREVLVESGADVKALEVDRKRTADFLGVDIADAPETTGGRKTWRLQVKWLPESQADGAFPRDADDYRDSAVYLKPVYAKSDGPAPSSLRIPVVGKADTPR